MPCRFRSEAGRATLSVEGRSSANFGVGSAGPIGKRSHEGDLRAFEAEGVDRHILVAIRLHHRVDDRLRFRELPFSRNGRASIGEKDHCIDRR